MQNNKKLIIGVGLLFIIPLAISILIIIYGNVVKEATIKTATETTIGNDLALAISEQNSIDLKNNVLHEIAKSSDYIAIEASSTKASDFGNNATIIVKKTDGEYKTIYYGTGYGPEDLVDSGVPRDFAKRLVTSNESRHSGIISDSALNPKNKYSLIQKLPITTDNLSINYYFVDSLKDDDGVNIPIIQISGTDAAERKAALNKMRNLGYDLGYYPVVFSNFRNPFSVTNTNWENTIKENSKDESDDNTEAIIDYNNDEEGP